MVSTVLRMSGMTDLHLSPQVLMDAHCDDERNWVMVTVKTGHILNTGCGLSHVWTDGRNGFLAVAAAETASVLYVQVISCDSFRRLPDIDRKVAVKNTKKIKKEKKKRKEGGLSIRRSVNII
ncbi:hypothetical protein Tco_0835190 [Tanacetum coccineum]